jgi:S1-C subfamily serine protease
MKVFPQCGVPAIGLSFLVSLLLGLAMPSLAAEDKKVTEADPIASNAIKNEAEVDEAGMPITTPPIDLSNTEADEMAQSIVKIYTTAEKNSALAPWNSDSESMIGTGFVIQGNRILTNAHVVESSTFIELQRDGKPERYEAEVLAISHEADLALLKVKDDSFFKKGKFLEIGELPRVHQEISVYGFPTGGDTLSVTKGIVSRIEYLEYAHSGLASQAIQIDAAINPGNSGGPALAGDKVVGVAMQVAANGEENIGYMIPPSIIKHFLKDLEDGRYDGFPEFAVVTQQLVNPALRNKHNLSKDQTGVLITKVCAGTTAEQYLKTGDIITKIDNEPIENNGTVLFQPSKYIDFNYRVDQHQLNDTLHLDIIRDGKALAVQLPLDRPVSSVYTHDKKPRYFIYGGYVFTPTELSEACQKRKDYDKNEFKDKTENVSIVKVLASSSNVGYHDLAMRIQSINGQTFNDFREFYKLMKQVKTPFITLEDLDGYQVVINRQAAEAEQVELLKRYNMESIQSPDLDDLEAELVKAKL